MVSPLPDAPSESGAAAAVGARSIGLVPADRIRAVEAPVLTPEIVDRYLALQDMTCAAADALDALRAGAVGARAVRAVREGSRVAGPAVTLRYEPVDPAAAADRASVLGDRDLYGLAPAGAVAVIDAGGACDHAVVGDVSAAWAALAGVAGVLVDGAVRDLEALGAPTALPVFGRGRSPRNARGRLDAVELNGPVRLDGALVLPGDLILADDNGVTVVPRALVEDVLDRCERACQAEAAIQTALAESPDVAALVARLRAESR